MQINIFPKILFTKTSLILLLVILIFLLVLYIWQTNVIIIQTYWRGALLDDLEKLNKEYSNLFVVYSKISSLENGANVDQLSEFESVDKVSYIKMLNGVVVAKNVSPQGLNFNNERSSY